MKADSVAAASVRADRLTGRHHKKIRLDNLKSNALQQTAVVLLAESDIGDEEIVLQTSESADHCALSDVTVSGRDVECQTDMTAEDILGMEHELRRLLCENATCRELLAADMSQESFSSNDGKVKFYTGLPNYCILLAIFNFVSPFVSNTHRNSLTKWNEFIAVLMRLRLNMPLQDLAYRFKVSVSTVSRLFSQNLLCLS